MSASLVGSEMCIRDRGGSSGRGVPAAGAAAGESAASSCARKVTWRGSRLPLPRAELALPAAEADRLKPPPAPLATQSPWRHARRLEPAPG
eukprot:452604-Alexandrium_andersonii.AAC.1